jgi:hypothetical protein
MRIISKDRGIDFGVSDKISYPFHDIFTYFFSVCYSVVKTNSKLASQITPIYQFFTNQGFRKFKRQIETYDTHLRTPFSEKYSKYDYLYLPRVIRYLFSKELTFLLSSPRNDIPVWSCLHKGDCRSFFDIILSLKLPRSMITDDPFEYYELEKNGFSINFDYSQMREKYHQYSQEMKIEILDLFDTITKLSIEIFIYKGSEVDFFERDPIASKFRNLAYYLVQFRDFVKRLSFYQKLTYHAFERENQVRDFIILDQERFFFVLNIVDQSSALLLNIIQKVPELDKGNLRSLIRDRNVPEKIHKSSF